MIEVIFDKGGAIMKALHYEADNQVKTEATTIQRDTKTGRFLSSTKPGRPMSFQEALKSSMAQFDQALHNLAK